MKGKDKILIAIFIIGLALRILFLVKGAGIYYPEGQEYTNNDSFSYSGSVINLVENGTYTFDLSNKNSAMGRLPGYPFFWGAIYYTVGEKYVYQAVALVQILLDCINMLFIYFITLKVFANITAARINAMIYAAYPFVIVWTTITGTESLGVFITLFFFYFLICKEPGTRNLIISGILLACAFYIRPYLAALLGTGYIYLLVRYRATPVVFFRKTVVLTLPFLLLYSLWPLRNYVNHDQLIFVKPVDSGYDRITIDVMTCINWIYSFDPDIGHYLAKIALTTDSDVFPDYVFHDEADKKQGDKLVSMARSCGTGFYYFKHYKRYPYEENCNEEIAIGFNQLKQSFIRHHLAIYLFKVPVYNFKKAVFKQQLVSQAQMSKAKKLAIKGMFSYRSLLLLLGVIGFIMAPGALRFTLLFFPLFMYVYICFYFRHLEMRYLLQADVMLIIGAGSALIFIKERGANVLKRLFPDRGKE